MKAKIRGTELYFDVLGEHIKKSSDGFVEKPVVILLHGGPGGDHASFKNYCPELAEVAQLIMYDQRGCGRSQRGDPATYTLENNIEDLEALRNYLGLDEFILYGHSYGGMLAQAYACRYPGAIKKLILGVTVCDGSFITAARQQLQQRGTTKQKAWETVIFDEGFRSNRQFADFFIDLAPLYSNKINKEGVKQSAFDELELSYQALNNGFLSDLPNMDFTKQLPHLTMPTLVFGAKDDWICPVEYSQKIAELVPSAKLVIFNESGHSVSMDEHEKYIKMLRDFIED